MQSKATSVSQYIAELPGDRRTAVEALRRVILANLDDDYEEGMQYGMIGYYVPHRVFPPGYHCNPAQPLPFAAIASQKNHLALYLGGVYCGCVDGGETDESRWFRDAWTRTGRKLDMGKSCVRFRRIDDVPLDVVGEAIRRLPVRTYLVRYKEALASAGKTPVKATAAKKKPAAAKKKPTSRVPAPRTKTLKPTKTKRPANPKKPV